LTAQSAAPGAARDEAERLKASGDALRQAAGLPGADPRSLLEAALAELDGAVEALTAAGGPTAADPGERPGDGPHTERRLLQAVFQQAPVPLFLLGPDGTVRRANSAAGQLLGSGSGSGYPTGKPFASFIEMPSRAALQSQLSAVVRTGKLRSLRCGVLAADGTAEREVTLCPVRVRGESAQLIAAVSASSVGAGHSQTATAGREPAPEASDEALRAVIRRLDLATAATRILLENVKHSESVTMQRFARLLSGELAAWVILDVERHHGLRRQLAAGPEDQPSDELARAVAAVDPPPGSAAYQVHESGSSLLVAHAEDAGMLGDGPDGVPLLMQLGATSVLCVPLSDGERSYGVLTLARPAGRGHFGMADVGLVTELGEQLALAMKVERMFRHSSEVASALQASVLPRRLRQIPGVEVAASHVSATMAQDAGADFYDVYPAQDGWGISIGDVCGKGQDVAAVTAAARHAIRVLAHWDSDPAGILRKANEIMMAEEFGGRFVTASVAHLRWRDGGWHVLLGSAGHPWPVLIKPDGRTERLQGSGLPLGIFPDAELSAQELELVPGDALFFFSDGLTSACGPDMVYFEDRLTDELAALAGEPADRVVGRVREIVLEFCRGQLRDDVTMLALRAGEPSVD
jgi:serine phosphatase RsbU (regulator of sigma subunit)/PAS domain-containing protein